MKAIEIINKNREMLVSKLIDNIENSDYIWQREWNLDGLSVNNPITETKYRGINKFLLGMYVADNELDDNRFMTFNQIKDKGYKLKEGSKSLQVEYWELKEYKVENLEFDENSNENSKESIKKVPIAKYYNVFSAKDIEGIPELEKRDYVKDEYTELIEDIKKASGIEIKEARQENAYYNARDHYIVMPPRENFNNEKAYLDTLLHEISHSTSKDLNREVTGNNKDSKYAKEELIAELAKIQIEAELGIDLREDNVTYKNTQAYIQSWSKELPKKEKTYIFSEVIKESSKAADLFMDKYLEYIKIKNIDLEKEDGDRLYKGDLYMYISEACGEAEYLKGEILTPELLEEIKKIDDRTKELNKGTDKIYFKQIDKENDLVCDYSYIKLGYGSKSNESEYKKFEDQLRDIKIHNRNLGLTYESELIKEVYCNYNNKKYNENLTRYDINERENIKDINYLNLGFIGFAKEYGSDKFDKVSVWVDVENHKLDTLLNGELIFSEEYNDMNEFLNKIQHFDWEKQKEIHPKLKEVIEYENQREVNNKSWNNKKKDSEMER